MAVKKLKKSVKNSSKSMKKSIKKRQSKSGKGLASSSLKLGEKLIAKKKSPTGKGFVNNMIDGLPFEMHLPGGYQYCGPGTKLDERLKRNDPGINELDRACKQHDIAYSKSNDIKERNQADEILAENAWKRVKSKNASLRERMAALGVTGIMKAKSKLGMGLKSELGGCKKNKKKQSSNVKKKTHRKSVSKVLKEAKDAALSQIKTKKPLTVPDAAKLAVHAAKVIIKKHNLPKTDIENGLPRIIPVPKKIGGALPLIPIFAGLSALGALMGGSASVANAAISANNAKKNFNEAQHHNRIMEAIALGKNTKTGSGLFLMPYKKGYGLFLSPYPKNV